MTELAQFNFALPRWPLDDPRMSGFTDNIQRINGLAERTPGYLWRMLDESGPDAPKFPEHPTMTITLSVWRDLESLRRFTWNTLHKQFRLRRSEWFVPWDGPYLALWPVPDGHRPNGGEAMAMLDKLHRQGPTAAVFGTEALMPEAA